MRKRFLLTFIALVGFILSASAEISGSFPQSSYKIKVGKTMTAKQPTFSGSLVALNHYAWESSNNSIATIGVKTGNVSAKAVGTVTITCYAFSTEKMRDNFINGTIPTAGYGKATYELVVEKDDGKLTAPPTAKDLTYNGSPQELVNAGSGTGTMEYSLDNSTWSSSIPTATNAGDYTVYYRLNGGANYSDVAGSSVNVTIKRKVLGSENIILDSDYGNYAFYDGKLLLMR